MPSCSNRLSRRVNKCDDMPVWACSSSKRCMPIASSRKINMVQRSPTINNDCAIGQTLSLISSQLIPIHPNGSFYSTRLTSFNQPESRCDLIWHNCACHRDGTVMDHIFIHFKK